MPLVFALLVIVVLFVLLWKLRDGEGPPRRPPTGGTGRGRPTPRPPRPPRPGRSVGPDDDPDFLRELDRRARPPGEEPDK